MGVRSRASSSSGSMSITVRCRLSSVAVSTPAGLLSIICRCFRNMSARPSSVTHALRSSTCDAGSRAGFPSTDTRPRLSAALTSLRLMPVSPDMNLSSLIKFTAMQIVPPA